MGKTSDKLKWCKVKLGSDLNWWVTETSDKVNWDADGLSVIDPRQTEHMIDNLLGLKEYGFDESIFEKAFLPFAIDSQAVNSIIKISRINDSIMDNEDQIFLLPNNLDDDDSPYAEFLDHITRLHIKMLNDCLDFEEEYTVDELEYEIREKYHKDYLEGKAIHAFTEVMDILEFVPFGYSLEEEEEVEEEEEEDDYSDIDDINEDEDLKEDDTMRWDEEEEEEEENFREIEQEDMSFDDDDDL